MHRQMDIVAILADEKTSAGEVNLFLKSAVQYSDRFKGRFHELTNHADERHKRQRVKKVDLREQIYWSAD